MNFSEKNECLNCGASLTTDFCGNCGQKKAQRISISLLLKIMQQGIIEFKSPFLVTFLGLFTNPGRVYREYLDGRRATYFNPIRYSFWLITIALFVAAYFQTSIINLDTFIKETNTKSIPVSALELEDILSSSVIYITFIHAFVCALFLKLFFRKEKYSISEWYIPCLLNFSQIFIVAIGLIFIGYYGSIKGQIFYSVCSTLYFIWGLSHLFEKRTWLTYLKVFAAGVSSFILFSMVFGILVFFTLGVKEGFNTEHTSEIEKPATTLPIQN